MISWFSSVNNYIYTQRQSFMCVCWQNLFGLFHFVWSSTFCLRLPRLSVTHWRGVSEERAECTATPPVSSEGRKTEPRANFTCDCQGDPAANVTTKTSRPHPALTAHLTLALRQIGTSQTQSAADVRWSCTHLKNKATVSDRLKGWEGTIKGKRPGHISKPSIYTGCICKSLFCAETHSLKDLCLISELLSLRSAAASLFLSENYVKAEDTQLRSSDWQRGCHLFLCMTRSSVH